MSVFCSKQNVFFFFWTLNIFVKHSYWYWFVQISILFVVFLSVPGCFPGGTGSDPSRQWVQRTLSAGAEDPGAGGSTSSDPHNPARKPHTKRLHSHRTGSIQRAVLRGAASAQVFVGQTGQVRGAARCHRPEWIIARMSVTDFYFFIFLGRSNTRLAEANSKLLNERSRSFITSSIANGSLVNPSLDVGALVSPGVTLNRSLGLGVLSPGSEGQNSRVEDYLAKVSTRTQLLTETGEWYFFSSPSYLRFIDLIVVSVVFCWYIQLKLVPSLFFLSVVNDRASIVSSVSHSFSF